MTHKTTDGWVHHGSKGTMNERPGRWLHSVPTATHVQNLQREPEGRYGSIFAQPLPLNELMDILLLRDLAQSTRRQRHTMGLFSTETQRKMTDVVLCITKENPYLTAFLWISSCMISRFWHKFSIPLIPKKNYLFSLGKSYVIWAARKRRENCTKQQ